MCPNGLRGVSWCSYISWPWKCSPWATKQRLDPSHGTISPGHGVLEVSRMDQGFEERSSCVGFGNKICCCTTGQREESVDNDERGIAEQKLCPLAWHLVRNRRPCLCIGGDLTALHLRHLCGVSSSSDLGCLYSTSRRAWNALETAILTSSPSSTLWRGHP